MILPVLQTPATHVMGKEFRHFIKTSQQGDTPTGLTIVVDEIDGTTTIMIWQCGLRWSLPL